MRNNETDSAEYTGVNKVVCGKMKINFDSAKVDDICFYSKPESKMYPVNQFPESEKHLKGLNWQVSNKPVIAQFLERKKHRNQLSTPKSVVHKQSSKKVKSKK